MATYEYDGLGCRIQKTVGETTDDYYYDESWQVLETRRGGDPDPLDQYVWDVRYVDAPVVRFHDGNTDDDLDGGSEEGDNTLYYTTDANWNVTALVDAATGAVVERYMYDAYGKVTILDGTTGGQTEWATDADQISDVANDILFAGYRFNSETGLYHVRNRQYHPTLGRWIERDPAGYLDGPNLYTYCRASPNGGTDPFGLTQYTWQADQEPLDLGGDFDLVIITAPDMGEDVEQGVNEWKNQRADDLWDGTEPDDLVARPRNAQEFTDAVKKRYGELGRPLRILIIGHGSLTDGAYIGSSGTPMDKRIPLLPRPNDPQDNDPGGMFKTKTPFEKFKEALKATPIGSIADLLEDLVLTHCSAAGSGLLRSILGWLGGQFPKLRVRAPYLPGDVNAYSDGFTFTPELPALWLGPWMFDTKTPDIRSLVNMFGCGNEAPRIELGP